MAIRKIIWTVSDDGLSISPTSPQPGGVQGENNATEVIFRVGEGSVWADAKYKVYVECEDAVGHHDATQPLQVEGGQISVLLPLAWTQYGGITTLRLVAEEEDGVIAYTVEGKATFVNRNNSSQKVDGLMKGRLAQMEAEMREAVADATSAAEDAAAAAEAGVVAKGGAENAAQSASVSREGAHHFATSAAASSATAVDAMKAAQKAAKEAEEAANQVGTAGGGGGTGGGGNTLIVTWDGDENHAASHSATGIYAHIQNGGTVFLLTDDKYFSVMTCTDVRVEFGYSDAEDPNVLSIFVFDDNSVEVYNKRLTESGGGVLVVSVDDEGNPSHSCAEVYAHVIAGGSAVLQIYGNVYGLSMCTEYSIFFTGIDDEGRLARFDLGENGVDEYPDFVIGDAGYNAFSIYWNGTSKFYNNMVSMIADHVRSGIPVVLRVRESGSTSDRVFSLGYVDAARADFYSFKSAGDYCCVTILRDGSVSMDGDTIATKWQLDDVKSDIAKINESLNKALTDIIKIQESLIGGGTGVTIITFTIDGVEYQAEEGMTLIDWAESEYGAGTHAVSLDNGLDYPFIYRASDNFGVSDAQYSLPANGNDVIVAGKAYYHVD